MKKLKQLIKDKDFAQAKAYILDNRERLEEIADCLLEEIEAGLNSGNSCLSWEVKYDIKNPVVPELSPNPWTNDAFNWEWARDNEDISNGMFAKNFLCTPKFEGQTVNEIGIKDVVEFELYKINGIKYARCKIFLQLLAVI